MTSSTSSTELFALQTPSSTGESALQTPSPPRPPPAHPTAPQEEMLLRTVEGEAERSHAVTHSSWESPLRKLVRKATKKGKDAAASKNLLLAPPSPSRTLQEGRDGAGEGQGSSSVSKKLSEATPEASALDRSGYAAMMKCALKRIQAGDASDDAGAYAEMEQAMKGLMDVLFEEKAVPVLPGVFMSNLSRVDDKGWSQGDIIADPLILASGESTGKFAHKCSSLRADKPLRMAPNHLLHDVITAWCLDHSIPPPCSTSGAFDEAPPSEEEEEMTLILEKLSMHSTEQQEALRRIQLLSASCKGVQPCTDEALVHKLFGKVVESVSDNSSQSSGDSSGYSMFWGYNHCSQTQEECLASNEEDAADGWIESSSESSYDSSGSSMFWDSSHSSQTEEDLTSDEHDIVEGCHSVLTRMNEDMLWNIFLYLPVDAVHRLRCVCRLWQSILSNKKFIEEHDKDRIKMPLFFYHPLLLVDPEEEPDLGTGDLEAIDLASGETQQILHFTVPLEGDETRIIKIHGCCQGIILLSYLEDLCVCNPATGRWGRLPPVHMSNSILGFYSSSLCPDGKEGPFLLYRMDNSTEAIISIRTLGTSENATRRICSAVPLGSSRELEIMIQKLRPAYEGPPAIVNSVLYWLLPLHIYQGSRFRLVAFDTKTEEFSFTDSPPVSIEYALQIFEAQGRLAMAVMNDDPSLISVWLLGEKAWSLYHQILMPVAEIEENLGLGEIGEPIIYIVSAQSDFLVWCPLVLLQCKGPGTEGVLIQHEHTPQWLMTVPHLYQKCLNFHEFLSLDENCTPPFFEFTGRAAPARQVQSMLERPPSPARQVQS